MLVYQRVINQQKYGHDMSFTISKIWGFIKQWMRRLREFMEVQAPCVIWG